MLLSEVPGYTVKAHIDVHVIYACFGGYDKLEYQLFHHQLWPVFAFGFLL